MSRCTALSAQGGNGVGDTSRNRPVSDRSVLSLFCVDGTAFGLTVLLAPLFHWRGEDVLWGIWTCGLCFPIACLLLDVAMLPASIVRNPPFGILRDQVLRDKWVVLVVGGPMVLLWIGSQYFILGAFLSEGCPVDQRLISMSSGLREFFSILLAFVRMYWLLLALTLPLRAWRGRVTLNSDNLDWFKRRARGVGADLGKLYGLAFLMYIMMGIGLESMTGIVILAIYCFPWYLVWQAIRRKPTNTVASSEGQ